MLAYRSAEHESLGTSPCSMLFGREINLPIDLVLGRPEYNEYWHELKTVYAYELSEKLEKIYQFARNRLKLSSDSMKRYYDIGTKMQNFVRVHQFGYTILIVLKDCPKLQSNRNRLDKLCHSFHGNKKEGFKKKLDSFHQTSWNFIGISTVVCGSFWGVDKIQNGDRCHGNQGAKNVIFTPNSRSFWNLTQK
jgi:hypothetical protein